MPHYVAKKENKTKKETLTVLYNFIYLISVLSPNHEAHKPGAIPHASLSYVSALSPVEPYPLCWVSTTLIPASWVPTVSTTFQEKVSASFSQSPLVSSATPSTPAPRRSPPQPTLFSSPGPVTRASLTTYPVKNPPAMQET